MTAPSIPLSIETRLDLLARLAPLGASFYARAERMKEVGLASFQTLMEFRESFCESAQERELHRNVVIEAAKERIGNFYPHPYLQDEPGPGYTSALLQRLRAERAARGNSFESYDRSKRWLIELDPCRYRLIEMMFTRNDELKKRQRPYLEAHARLRQDEIARYATALSANVADSASVRRKLCAAVLAELLGPLGFQAAGKVATQRGALVEKPLAGGWCLLWSVDLPNLRKPAHAGSQDQTGWLDLNLDLAPCSNLAPSSDQTIGSAPLRIGYNYAAPIDRTDWDYGNFRSLPELETLLRAHAIVYAMMHEQIESALLTGLKAAVGRP